MSTVSAAEPAATLLRGPLPFLLRRLHSLTGVMFGLYVLLHLSVNASLIEGARHDGDPTVYQLQVDKIHSLPFLNAVSWTFLLGPIIYHTIYGLYITINGRPNVIQYGYARNWLYMLQRWSALVLILFIAFHYLAFKGAFNSLLGNELHFVPSKATESTVLHLQSHWWIGWIVYPLGLLAATFHTANGFYAAAVAWGLTISKGAQRRWGFVCVLLFLFLTAAGFVAIGSSLKQKKPALIDPSIPRVGTVQPSPQA